MTVFDPLADLSRLRGQIDRLFDQDEAGRQQGNGSRVWRPAVDLFEDEDSFTLKADMPDVARETLDVQVSADELVIRGERAWVKPERGGCVHSERPYGQFVRTFRIGVPLQSDRVEASYRDGVLTLRLPKADTVKPRKIAVRSEGE